MRKYLIGSISGLILLFLLTFFNQFIYSNIEISTLFQGQLMAEILILSFSVAIFIQSWFGSAGQISRNTLILGGFFLNISILGLSNVLLAGDIEDIAEPIKMNYWFLELMGTNLISLSLLYVSARDKEISIKEKLNIQQLFLIFGLLTTVLILIFQPNFPPIYKENRINLLGEIIILINSSILVVVMVRTLSSKRIRTSLEGFIFFFAAFTLLLSQWIPMLTNDFTRVERFYVQIFKLIADGLLVGLIINKSLIEAKLLNTKPDKYDLKTLDDYSSLVKQIDHMVKGAILSIKINRVNRIRSVLGHRIGNEVLEKMAGTLRASMKEKWRLTQISEDQFCILVPEMIERRKLIPIINQISVSTNQDLKLNGYHLNCSSHIGICLFDKDAKNADELIRNANLAMHEAEKSNETYYFYNPKLYKDELESLMIEIDMRRAIRENEFVLHYQPQVELIEGEIKGIEALVRWNHPQYGLIPPAKFIPIAEKTDDIAILGKWVLKEACKQLREWNDRGLHDLNISVNLSVRQLLKEYFIEELKETIKEARIDPSKLTVEITESMAAEFDQILPILFRIKALGVKIAIDDFGTGYSSLSYLTKLPFDYLKIDRLFIEDILQNKEHQVIVDSIISIADQLGAVTVAEGVETVSQYELLKDKNCHKIQGYWISKPLEASIIFEKFLSVNYRREAIGI